MLVILGNSTHAGAFFTKYQNGELAILWIIMPSRFNRRVNILYTFQIPYFLPRGSISGWHADLVGRRDFEIGMRKIEMVVIGSD